MSKLHISAPTFLGFLFLWVMAATVFFPLSLPLFVPLLGLTGTVVFYLSSKRLPKIDHSISLVILTTCGLTIASSFWSITPEVSLERAFKISALLLLSAPLLFLCKEMPYRSLSVFKKWAILPLLIAALILFIELKFAYPLYRYFANIPDDVPVPISLLNKHVGTLILMTPIGIILAFRSRVLTPSLLLIILCGLVITATESQSAQLAVIAIIMSIPLLLLMPNATPKIILGGTAFLIIFMPWIAPVAFDAFAEPLAKSGTVLQDANMPMRLENWDFISRRIIENPLTGFGIDTTRAMSFDSEERYFRFNKIMHPHNMPLQIWIEFGLLGATFASLCIAFLYRRLKKLPFSGQFLPLSLFCGIMVFLMVSWSIWAAWLDALIVWIMGLLILVTRPKDDRATS